MPRLAFVAPLFVLFLHLAAPVSAQDVAADAPAHISIVDGSALLERDGRSETAPASMPILAGDRLRTQNGRVEVLFGDGSTLHLDVNTVVDFQSDEVIRLLDGRVRLNVPGGGRDVNYRVDAPSAWVQIIRSGEYRISVLGASGGAREAEVELAVLRGAAELVNEDGRTSIGAGERAFARAGNRPSAAYVYNSASWDAFDRWSESQRDSRLGVSAEYLPESVQTYASTFNQYGYWQNEPTYGYVWYPRVRAGWRPYYYGQWTSLRPWGWTWIGSDPWAWPTHHYGRWGFSAGSWFWIPGRTWGPAWVSWAYAPGYVSWCPLGWNNRAVFGFSGNFYGGHRFDPWNAWTVVPHRGFGRGFVNANVVNSTRIDVNTRSAFVVRDRSPDVVGYAVPRSSAPIRSVGARGPSRGDNAVYRGSQGGSRTGSVADVDGAAATFRSRGSSAAPLTGTGYPAPSRTPRAVGSLPAPTRQTSPRSNDSTSPAGPDGRATNAPAGSSIERRAVPRGAAPSAPADATTAPSRRTGPSEIYSPGTSTRPEINRAVPRSERPARPDNDASAPPSSLGTTPSRTYRSPSPEGMDQGQRAVPRSAPDSGYRAPESYRAPDSYRAPEGYRAPDSRPADGSRSPQGGGQSQESQPSRPGPERSSPAPNGPPPSSAAPSRPSGSSSGSSGSSGSGSRSGGGSISGRAVPRGGRG